MSPRAERVFALIDVIGLPVFILSFIWRLQFSPANWWIVLVLWLAGSFALHRDTPKTLGWRADNLGCASWNAAIAFALMAAGLFLIGVALRQPIYVPGYLISYRRLGSYFAFCVMQQVALNSLLMNRTELLISRRWLAALFVGVIFAACHWPNPVLVPLTLIGGAVMAWLFGRERNIIPLAVIQALLGTIVWWAFPLAWHHHLRVGPGYYVR
jgi:membrane protease YdiL (CAAX protease family)